MINSPLLDKDYRLYLQNSLCLEYYQKRMAISFLKNFVKSASILVEKFIAEGLFFGLKNFLEGLYHHTTTSFFDKKTTKKTGLGVVFLILFF